MAEKPILFSAPMVRALLEGRKTQTRRILKQPKWAQDSGWPEGIMDEQDLCGRLSWFHRSTGCCSPLPIPQPGDRLWVKETWRPLDGYSNWDLRIRYNADGAERHFDDGDYDSEWNWPKAAKRGNVSPLFMPKWASRLTLNVSDVRVERLQDIDASDCLSEGVEEHRDSETGVPYYIVPGAQSYGWDTPQDSFHALWHSINGPDAWLKNPWVVAVSFDVRTANINAITPPSSGTAPEVV